jgi:hypothetical protein
MRISPPTPRALTSTERSRLTRERKSYGGRVIPVEVYEAEVTQLVSAGLLSESARGDRLAIGRAIEKLLDLSARKPN